MSELQEQFADLEQQEEAAKVGVWLLVASEVLLFGALFTLYSAIRVRSPEGFHEGVRHMSLGLGTLNTFILLTSSLTAALSVAMFRLNRTRASLWMIAATSVLAIGFLVVKGFEYTGHLEEGLGPTAVVHPSSMSAFITLYWIMTGLHAFHVCAGLVVFAWIAWRIQRGTTAAYQVELATVYWHFVDLVWIFLWPTFYLTRGA